VFEGELEDVGVVISWDDTSELHVERISNGKATTVIEVTPQVGYESAAVAGL
jgi:hypothetical protein